MSDFLIESFKSVENLSLLFLKFFTTNSSKPGSYIGIIPFLRLLILFSSLSTHITSLPRSEKHVPLTRPTYPVPIMHNFII